MKRFIGRSKRNSAVSAPWQLSAPDPDTASSYTTAAPAPMPRSVNAHNPYAQTDEYGSSASDGDYNPYASSYSSRSVNESSYANPYESAQPRTNPYDVSRSSVAYQKSQLPSRSSGSSQTYSASSSYGNPYGASESATTARAGYTAKQPEDDTVSFADSTRRELFRGVDSGRQKPGTLTNYPSKNPEPTQTQTQTQMYIKPESSTYDPSIMETEAERADRYGGTPAATTSGENPSTTVNFDDLRVQDEQEEQREVESLQKQIREVKIDSLSTAQRALKTAEEAEASAIRTMERLDDQRSRLGSIDNSLSVSGSQIQIGDSHVNELRTINRSMFAVHVSKPWSSQRRLQERDQKIRDSFAAQQQARDLNNSQQSQSRARLNDVKSAQFRRAPQIQQGQQQTTASRYQFEPDDEDFELENDIESTLDSVGAASSRLNAIASTIGTELDSQISYIGRLGDKSTKVENDINLTTVKLSRIH